MKPRATKITQELQYWPFSCRSSSDDISRKGHIYSWERRKVKRSWKLCRNSCYVFKKLQLGFRIKGFFLFSCTLKFTRLSILTQNEAITVSKVVCRCPKRRGCLRTEMCEHSVWILLYLLLPMRSPEINIFEQTI